MQNDLDAAAKMLWKAVALVPQGQRAAYGAAIRDLHGIQIGECHTMAPVLLFLDITPKTAADHQKLTRALQVLAAEHDNVEVQSRGKRDCTVIGATSEVHLNRSSIAFSVSSR